VGAPSVSPRCCHTSQSPHDRPLARERSLVRNRAKESRGSPRRSASESVSYYVVATIRSIDRGRSPFPPVPQIESSQALDTEPNHDGSRARPHPYNVDSSWLQLLPSSSPWKPHPQAWGLPQEKQSSKSRSPRQCSSARQALSRNHTVRPHVCKQGAAHLKPTPG